MTAFNYDPIRTTAIALINKFGRQVQCVLLRTLETAAADSNKPWRRGDPTILEFKFIGVISTLGFPKKSDPITDRDLDIIIPGDLATTGAEGSPLVLCGDPVALVDRIQVGDALYQILGVQDITPDDKTIIYKVRARAWPVLAPQATGNF